jgi:hypothetical protein
MVQGEAFRPFKRCGLTGVKMNVSAVLMRHQETDCGEACSFSTNIEAQLFLSGQLL